MACVSDSSISSSISFRTFLAKLADDLTVSDLKRLKFLLDQPAGVKEKITDPCTYLEFLETKGFIAINKLDYLKEVFNKIGRNDLERKTNEFIKNEQVKQPVESVCVEIYDKNLNQPIHAPGLSVNLNRLPDSNESNYDKKICESESTQPVGIIYESKPTSESDKRTKILPAPNNLKPQTKKLMNPNDFIKAQKSTKDLQKDILPSENTPNKFIPEIRRKDTQPSYIFNNDPVGICHIISNNFDTNVLSEDDNTLSARHGTQKDVLEIQKVFLWLNFQVEIHYDKDVFSIIDIIKQPPVYNKNQQTDCFVCFILSHGFKDGIYGSDGKKLSFDDMQAAINGNFARWLIGKPKLFFIQACQGHGDEKEIYCDSPAPFDQKHTALNNPSLAENADFCFSVAAVPGTVSWRHSREGSWYIQSLCRILKKFSNNEHLLDMLTFLNHEIGSKADTSRSKVAKQMSTLRIMTLTKRVFFNPKGSFVEPAFLSVDQASHIEVDLINLCFNK